MTIKVLVLGGSYFVGRRLVEDYARDGDNVTVLNRGTHPVPQAEQLTADRNLPQQMNAALQRRSFDWVVDTSCYTAEQARITLDALGGRFTHYLLLSSAAVYVEDGRIPMPETHPTGCSPQWGDYGLQKWQADQVLLHYANEHRQAVTIIRPPYIYGPGNNLEREQFFWSRLLRNRPILLPGEGDTPVQFLHIDDLYSFMRLALGAPHVSAGQIFNLGNPTSVTFKDLIKLLAEVAGVTAQTVPVPYQQLGLKPRDFFPFRDYPCVLDVTRAQQILGWKPIYDLRAGLAHTFQSYNRTWLAERPLDTTLEDQLLQG